MPWTARQRTIFHAAANLAGWPDERRYIAMKHVGCPLKDGRPSVTHPKNTLTMFDRCMALAEADAAVRGKVVRPPGRYKSWREAERHECDRVQRLVLAIVEEAKSLLPAVFDPPIEEGATVAPPGLLDGTVRHVCGNDDREFLPIDGVPRFETLDAGQLYRVVESLKARVGRELLERGMTPRSFEVPAEARRRVAANQAKSGGRA